MRYFLIVLSLIAWTTTATAAVEIPNQVSVTMTANVTYDPASGLFTYHYTAASGATSVQEVSSLYVPVAGSVMNIVSPQGWESGVAADGLTVRWSASAEEGFIPPPGYVDDGNLLPSVYQIKPGTRLGGFSFQSPDAPVFGAFYAEGFVRIPVEGIDFAADAEPVVPAWPDNLFKGTTKAPAYAADVFLGGRRPAVDGFLVFRNIQNRDVRPAPVLIDIQFALNGESVNQATFKALLNNVDITSKFVITGANKRRAVLEIGLGQLKLGSNVLLTSVEGVVPGTARTAADTDRISFTVNN